MTWATCADELEIQAYERGYRAGHYDGRRRAEECARAWQALRDWLNGDVEQWANHALNEYLRGVTEGYTEGLNGGQA